MSWLTSQVIGHRFVYIGNAKMATTVVEFGVSGEKVEFSGSSDDDLRHAKMFWQSMQLNPPMESALVSKDITQRLKVAPPGHQGWTRYDLIDSRFTAMLMQFVV